MNIIKQEWGFVADTDGEQILRLIELAGRTCYKSEDSMTPASARSFCKKIINSGHHSVIEHQNITIKIITDRGVTHEIVRHRLASYSQESTRYCNYGNDKFGNEITVILPVWFYGVDPSDPEFCCWKKAMMQAEIDYLTLLIDFNQSPQQARSVLPNSLKTEIVMTCNIREWRHFFTLRCSKAAHPQMRELALSMLEGFKKDIPVLFDDLYPDGEKPC